MLAGLAALAGCTADNHDLPTLGGHRGPTLSALEAVAKEYYDCMRDANLPVELQANGQGERAVVNFTGEHSILARTDNGSGMAMSSNDDPAFQQQVDAFFSDLNAGTALIIDGVDHSEVYAQCLKKSGYDEQAAWGMGSMMDQAVLAKQVEANNRWASCAREHGWPMLKDSVMPKDSNEWPTVLLPVTTTESQLRTLLAACPNFDPTQQEKLQDWWNSNPMGGYPDDYLPEPSIAFDVADPTKSDPNLDKLYTVLYEQISAYYNKQDGNDNDNGVMVASPVPAPR